MQGLVLDEWDEADLAVDASEVEPVDVPGDGEQPEEARAAAASLDAGDVPGPDLSPLGQLLDSQPTLLAQLSETATEPAEAGVELAAIGPGPVPPGECQSGHHGGSNSEDFGDSRDAEPSDTRSVRTGSCEPAACWGCVLSPLTSTPRPAVRLQGEARP